MQLGVGQRLSKGWRTIIVRRLSVGGALALVIWMHQAVEPPLQIAVGLVALPIGVGLHYLAGTAKCPVCNQMFASTGDAGKDFFQLLFRTYFSIRCGHCRSIIGSGPETLTQQGIVESQQPK